MVGRHRRVPTYHDWVYGELDLFTRLPNTCLGHHRLFTSDGSDRCYVDAADSYLAHGAFMRLFIDTLRSSSCLRTDGRTAFLTLGEKLWVVISLAPRLLSLAFVITVHERRRQSGHAMQCRIQVHLHDSLSSRCNRCLQGAKCFSIFTLATLPRNVKIVIRECGQHGQPRSIGFFKELSR